MIKQGKYRLNINITILGLVLLIIPGVWAQNIDERGYIVAVGLDPNADIFALYADRKAGITRNVIIDKTGKIVMLTRLFNDEEFGKMKELIDEMVK